MRIYKMNLSILAIVMLFTGTTLFAQQEDTKKDKKVVIITKTVDADGKVQTEKIIKEGNDADVFILKKHDGENVVHGNVNVDVDNQEGTKRVKIVIDEEAGDDVKVIEWNGEGEMPADLLETLEKRGIEMELKDKHNIFHFDTDRAPNRACLGVMIRSKKTVENINGEETIVVEGGSKSGVAIIDIIEESGAFDAGLSKDDVITKINGVEVMSIKGVHEVLAPKSAGDVISVDYIRGESVAQVEATLKACKNTVTEVIEEEIEWNEDGEMPAELLKKLEKQKIELEMIEKENVFRLKRDYASNRACLGVMIGKKEIIENVNGEETVVEEGESKSGVTILNIIEESGAFDAGLSKDDVITKINGTEVMSIQAVHEVLAPKSPGDIVLVNYVRGESVAQVEATLKACKNTVTDVIEEEIEWLEEEGEMIKIKSDNIIFIENEGDGEVRKIIIKKRKSEEEPVVEGIEILEDSPVVEGVEILEESPEITPPKSQTLDLERVDIFPNPTDGRLTIKFEAPAVATVLKIVDLSGREVYNEVLNNFDGIYNKEINLDGAPNGALILSIQQDDKVFSEKLILQR